MLTLVEFAPKNLPRLLANTIYIDNSGPRKYSAHTIDSLPHIFQGHQIENIFASFIQSEEQVEFAEKNLSRLLAQKANTKTLSGPYVHFIDFFLLCVCIMFLPFIVNKSFNELAFENCCDRDIKEAHKDMEILKAQAVI